jgi:hypothetical protein
VAAITLKIGTWWFALILMIPLMSIVFYALKRCLDFAECNPQAAIMDGAEFLVHEKIVHGRKGEDEIPIIEATTAHAPPELPEAEVLSQDPPPSASLEQKNEGEE